MIKEAIVFKFQLSGLFVTLFTKDLYAFEWPGLLHDVLIIAIRLTAGHFLSSGYSSSKPFHDSSNKTENNMSLKFLYT